MNEQEDLANDKWLEKNMLRFTAAIDKLEGGNEDEERRI